jgi:hypothetical protein
MPLLNELIVGAGLWITVVLVGGGDRIAKAIGLENCKTNCESKPYAVPEYRIGKQARPRAVK